MQGTEVQESLRGQVNLTPSVELPGTLLLRSADCPVIVGEASANVLRQVTVVPVAQLSGQTWLLERQVDGWTRVMDTVTNQQPHDVEMIPPLILSSRRDWYFEQGTTRIFKNASIIDGAHRFMHLLTKGRTNVRITFAAFTGLTTQQELELRAMVAAPTTADRKQIKFGSDTQRLVIGTSVETFTIESEPFVIATAFGYTPAVLIRRSSTDLLEHVLIQAQSIAGPLERIRQVRGTLVGVSVQVRKRSAERTAPYEVQEA